MKEAMKETMHLYILSINQQRNYLSYHLKCTRSSEIFYFNSLFGLREFLSSHFLSDLHSSNLHSGDTRESSLDAKS